MQELLWLSGTALEFWISCNPICSDRLLDLFQVVPGLTPLLHFLYIANLPASLSMGCLISIAYLWYSHYFSELPLEIIILATASPGDCHSQLLLWHFLKTYNNSNSLFLILRFTVIQEQQRIVIKLKKVKKLKTTLVKSLECDNVSTLARYQVNNE